MFEDDYIEPGAPGLFTHELFLPWIHNLMLAYQGQESSEKYEFTPGNTKYSKAYYTRKVN